MVSKQDRERIERELKMAAEESEVRRKALEEDPTEGRITPER